MRLPRLLSALTLFLVIALPGLAGTIVYVDANATGANNGTSWCDAYTELQIALGEAANPSREVSEIRVANGEYRPAGPGGGRAGTFRLVSGVNVTGGFAGCGAIDPDLRDVEVYETVLSGDLNENDGTPSSSDCCIGHGATGCDDQECSNAVCLVNPYCCNIVWDSNCAEAATVFCANICRGTNDNVHHVVTCSGCFGVVLDGFTIQGGNANVGSGLADLGGGLISVGGSLAIVRCIFSENFATWAGGAIVATGNLDISDSSFMANSSDGPGSSIYAEQASLSLHRCTFNANSGNSTVSAGSNIVNFSVIDSTFHANGGSALSAGADSIVVIRTTVTGNGSGAGFGGGTVQVYDSLFVGNGSYGLSASGANVSIDNCTVANNTFGGVACSGSGSRRITNCIVWGNGAANPSNQIIAGNPVGLSVNYSCVQGYVGQFEGVGTITTDPLFVDPSSGNFHIQTCSPCVNSGAPIYVPPGGAIDIDGDERILGVAVDIGADEVPHVDGDQDGIPDECVVGACCEADGTCTQTVEAACGTATWTMGQNCVPNVCPVIGSCCRADGECDYASEADCGSGLWAANGSCSPSQCLAAPVVVPIGGRYLQVEAATWSTPIALHVTSPDIPCLSRYVAFDSGRPTLIDNPVYFTGTQWGTVAFSDNEVRPGTTYRIQAVNAAGQSAYGIATTWAWGDVDNTTTIDVDDILCTLDTFVGFFGDCALEATDLADCIPNGEIDVDDVLAVLDAFQGHPFPCPSPCP